jgi:dTDP-4-amino-4,6-dideoxygalactose transaminase
MKSIPVTIPYFDGKEAENVKKVLDSGWVAQGPVVAQFEEAVCAHEKIGHGVATTSCTTALHLAMAAEGLAAGMDVIVPAFTFVATANAAVETGAVPVFADICQETFNIDTKHVRKIIEKDYTFDGGKLYNNETKNVLWGIVPVHEFGLCCDIGEINRIAEEYHLKVIEDAACALGAKIGGTHQGGFGNTSCISFHPRKSITTGEGGMVLTNDAALAKRMKELRTHGSTVSADARHAGKGFLLPEFPETGYNYRMTDIQAAVGMAQIEKLDQIVGEKRRRAAIYDKLIGQTLPEFRVPYVPEGYFHTYQSYVCMLDLEKLHLDSVELGGQFRNRLLSALEEAGVATRQGTHAVHMLGYYRDRFGYSPKDFPNAYACDHLSVTLPLYIQMSDDDQAYVVEKIRETIDKL